jgi:hypothetical protein
VYGLVSAAALFSLGALLARRSHARTHPATAAR